MTQYTNGLTQLVSGGRFKNGNGSKLHNPKEEEYFGDNHIASGIETPLKPDAFVLDDQSKMEIIEHHFEQIMETLGLDLTDDSLRGTPHRVAKMFVKEIFYGLHPNNKPTISVFENKFRYGQILVEKNIRLNSFCEHHFLPITGKAHIGYISTGTVIGLSKINRLVDYYSHRPQVQERLTVQIAAELKQVLKTEDVAVLIEATHMCVSCRGIRDESSSTLTTEYSGAFNQDKIRQEFLRYVDHNI